MPRWHVILTCNWTISQIIFDFDQNTKLFAQFSIVYEFYLKQWHLFHHLLKSLSIRSHMFHFRMIFQNILPFTWDAPFFFFFCPFEKKEVLLLFVFKFFSCMVSKLFLTFFFSTLKFCYTWSLNPFTGVFCSYQNCKWKMTFLFWHIPPEVYHDGSDEACTGKCKCADHLNHMHQYMQSCEIIMNKINK